ncbi:MAG TPA: zf-HC2 domain-containing protein [Granulicella sp.]|jgi:hypothetical protein|nr:zf-HC2 domain-containing protein [Granulicella sp.]
MNFREINESALPEAPQLPPPEACRDIRACFSDYLDGAVSGHAMHTIASHLEACSECAAEFTSWRAMQQALAGLRSAKAPADLGLKLRCAISRQKAARDAHWADKYIVRWENAVRPMLIQVSAGLAGAIVLIGSIAFLLGIVAAPQPVLANDVPLDAVTAPHYLYSAASSRPILTDRDTTIVVDASINDRGQVYDYRIVSAPESPEVQSQITEQLMLYVFEPARVFGSPVRGHVVVTFDGISVRG